MSVHDYTTYSQDSQYTATQPSQLDLIEPMEQTEEFDLPYWGRLYPAQECLRFHDLTKNEITVGKLKTCDICLKNDEFIPAVWAVVSRHHFTLLRISEVDKFGAMNTKIVLKDLSMNGTFVNKNLVGKNNSTILKDNQVIAFGHAENSAYYFKMASAVNDNIPQLLFAKYDICKKLGTGAYGEVSLVFSKETGKAYAMKSILKGSSANQRRLDMELEKLENEVTILRKIKHPNVIQLVDDIDCDSQKYLILENMVGGDLFNRIRQCKRLTEFQAKLYFYQIASGVQYLHCHGIIHRDLKPENVLLACNNVETVVKISDFGLSKVLHSETYLRSLCGTKMYVAPEILKSKGTKKYTAQVDVWSMGVILYVGLSGQNPFFSERDGKDMETQIIEGAYDFPSNAWEGVSIYAQRIIKKMMAVNPDRRISITDIFTDRWMQDSKIKDRLNSLVLRQKSQNKENVPVTDQVEDCSSPLSAALKHKPSRSPPKKRARVK